MPEKSSYDVFLSYSSQDKPWVAEFVSTLKGAGVRPWFDVWELVPGEPWQEKLEEALRKSRTFVVVLSPHNAGSPWTFFELGAAIADDKRIIPVATEDLDLTTLPVALRRLQFLKEPSSQAAGRRLAEVLGKARLSGSQRPAKKAKSGRKVNSA